jgi:hypothetical protein
MEGQCSLGRCSQSTITTGLILWHPLNTVSFFDITDCTHDNNDDTQGKIRADGCPAARDDTRMYIVLTIPLNRTYVYVVAITTDERIFVRSKERPYYVSRAQLQYWQDRRGRTHDIIGYP